MPSAEVVVEDATRGPVRFAGDEISDFVLVRADGRPTFDLATSVDDRDLAITHIVRGEDHLANSARHLLLLRALGAVEPVFAHCPIIVGADGERLSTRRGAEPLAALRARGVPPEAVVAFAAQLACPAQGGADEVASFAELAAALLARAPRPRHGARRSRAPGLDGPRGPGAACRSRSSPAGWRRSCPSGTPDARADALAEAARGASALGEIADSAAALAQRPGRAAAGRPGAGALLRAARGRRARAPARTRRR